MRSMSPTRQLTYALIAINVLVFVAQIATGAGGLDATSGSVFRDGALYGPLVADGDWWRIVTGGFLHARPAAHRLQHVLRLLPRGHDRAGDRQAAVRGRCTSCRCWAARSARCCCRSTARRSELRRRIRPAGRRDHPHAIAGDRPDAVGPRMHAGAQPRHHVPASRASPSAGTSAASSPAASRRCCCSRWAKAARHAPGGARGDDPARRGHRRRLRRLLAVEDGDLAASTSPRSATACSRAGSGVPGALRLLGSRSGGRIDGGIGAPWRSAVGLAARAAGPRARRRVGDLLHAASASGRADAAARARAAGRARRASPARAARGAPTARPRRRRGRASRRTRSAARACSARRSRRSSRSTGGGASCAACRRCTRAVIGPGVQRSQRVHGAQLAVVDAPLPVADDGSTRSGAASPVDRAATARRVALPASGVGSRRRVRELTAGRRRAACRPSSAWSSSTWWASGPSSGGSSFAPR